MPLKWCSYKLFWRHCHVFPKLILAVSKCSTATVVILQAVNQTRPDQKLFLLHRPKCIKCTKTLVQVSHFLFNAFLKTTIPFLCLIKGVLFSPKKIWDMVYDTSVQDETFAAETLRPFHVPLFPMWNWQNGNFHLSVFNLPPCSAKLVALNSFLQQHKLNWLTLHRIRWGTLTPIVCLQDREPRSLAESLKTQPSAWQCCRPLLSFASDCVHTCRASWTAAYYSFRTFNCVRKQWAKRKHTRRGRALAYFQTSPRYYNERVYSFPTAHHWKYQASAGLLKEQHQNRMSLQGKVWNPSKWNSKWF